MRKIGLIIAREFKAKVRHKTFIVMTFLSPLLALGIGALIVYLSSIKPEVKTIWVTDPQGIFYPHLPQSDAFHYIPSPVSDPQAQRIALQQEEVDGLLWLPAQARLEARPTGYVYVSAEPPGLSQLLPLEQALSKVVTTRWRQSQGIAPERLARTEAQVSLRLQKDSGEQGLKGINELKMALGSLFGYLIMMFIIIYGNMVMRSVIEEKTSRIIEIIVSSVRPFELMMGKIIGTSLAGLLQFVIWLMLGGLGWLALSAFGLSSPTVATAQSATEATGLLQQLPLYLHEMREWPIGWMLGSFMLYFAGGYLLYSALYAAIGAAVDSETDSQQFLMPVIMPLVLGVYIGFFAVINNPQGPVAVFFSLFPLTSPIVMLMRMPFGVPLWQWLLSVTLLLGTFWGLVQLAARIYKAGILSYGKKPTWAELWQWLRRS